MRWPEVSGDGRVIVFEHDFGIWKLDVASKKATSITLNIAAETQENLSEVQTFSSQVFTAPVEEGDLKQITDGPARDRLLGRRHVSSRMKLRRVKVNKEKQIHGLAG